MKSDVQPRILVIDDEPSIRSMLVQALEIGNFAVRDAEDGEQGLALLKEDRSIGVILTDLMMPRMNGMEVLEQAKQYDPDVEVIVLTGFGGHESAIEAMKKGAYDYLQKPTNVEELFLTVGKAIERRRLAQENRLYQENLERLVRDRTEELLETKNFLQSVLDSSLDYSIVALDLDGHITLFNRGSERLFGHTASEVEGKPATSFFKIDGGSDPSPFALEGALTQGTVQEHQRVVTRKDGEEITISISLVALCDQEGEEVGTLGISKDITEQIKLELELKKYTENLEQLVEERTKELEKRNAELETTLAELSDTQAQLVQSEKLASIGQLAAGVAHEINNPIGFVHSNLGTLGKYFSRIREVLDRLHQGALNGEQLPAEELEELWKKSRMDSILADLENIIAESLDGTKRVRTIVRDMKNFSNIDRAEIQPSDLEAGLESTLNIVWNEIKYNANVEREYSSIPAVTCNAQQINQVLLNLLMNAAQAIKEPPGNIIVRTREMGDGFVAIEIEDNGSGMDEKTKSRIFDPFYTTKAVGEGTGLGLSISYRIIKDHGGRIEVDSEVGKGTTFRLILPIEGPMVEATAD
ncbi:response regulator [bacterium]|nr:response regulator [bacterium]